MTYQLIACIVTTVNTRGAFFILEISASRFTLSEMMILICFLIGMTKLQDICREAGCRHGYSSVVYSTVLTEII